LAGILPRERMALTDVMTFDLSHNLFQEPIGGLPKLKYFLMHDSGEEIFLVYACEERHIEYTYALAGGICGSTLPLAREIGASFCTKCLSIF
jgi:hypothetical protein